MKKRTLSLGLGLSSIIGILAQLFNHVGSHAMAAEPTESMRLAAVKVHIARAVRVSFQTEVGKQYRILATIDVGSGDWSPVGDPVKGTGEVYEFYRDSETPEKTFYKVETISGGAAAPSGMVLIPAGHFEMGDTFNEGNTDERPVHRVEVIGFYMDQYEVTKALWDKVYDWAVGNGYTFNNPGEGKAANHPVHTVSWYDVVKWCNARSEMEGRTPAYYTSDALSTVFRTGRVNVRNDWVNWGGGYRLPTEAEWEKAARGGLSGRRFPWGDTITHDLANYYSMGIESYDVSPTQKYHPDYDDGDFPYTSPVGSFGVNGYGLHDMAGNVREWCWDWYGGSYYGSSPGGDPRGSSSGPARVFRGGSWYFGPAWEARVAIRRGSPPDGKLDRVGFRSVLSAGQP